MQQARNMHQTAQDRLFRSFADIGNNACAHAEALYNVIMEANLNIDLHQTDLSVSYAGWNFDLQQQTRCADHIYQQWLLAAMY